MQDQGPAQALPNPPGKHVPSSAPGAAVRDLSGDLQRHRETTDATVTTPPGGYPVTAGGNPDPPADRQASDDGMTGVAVSAPGPYSQGTKWVGGGAVQNPATGSY